MQDREVHEPRTTDARSTRLTSMRDFRYEFCDDFCNEFSTFAEIHTKIHFEIERLAEDLCNVN